MELKELIAKARNTSPYENLKEILGNDLGTLLYKIVREADKADQELDIVHGLIRELYEDDSYIERVRMSLADISKIQSDCIV